MTDSHGTADAGMRAVARVRAVRERDSRLGLQQSLAEQHRLADERSACEAVLRDRTPFAGGSIADFVARRRSIEYAASALAAAGVRLVQAQGVTASAQRHWQQDKIRLSSVEMLLARRAAERRAERERREAAALDEIATELWRRSREGGR